MATVWLGVERFLLSGIAHGTYPPGSRLPSIRDLAAQLGVSTTSVRTALAHLVLTGTIEVRHGSGHYVPERAGDDLAALRGRIELLEQRLEAHVRAGAAVGHSADAR